MCGRRERGGCRSAEPTSSCGTTPVAVAPLSSQVVRTIRTFTAGSTKLIPGDIPEETNGSHNPDHGELWTTALGYRVDDCDLVLEGQLPICGLHYERRLYLRPDTPYLDMDYCLSNPNPVEACLHVEAARRPADCARGSYHLPSVVCTGSRPEMVTLAQRRAIRHGLWWTTAARTSFLLPMARRISCTSMTCKWAQWRGRATIGPWLLPIVSIRGIFPYRVQYFSSYGGMDGHYTAVLEPCTCMPISVNEAARLGAVFEPGTRPEPADAHHPLRRSCRAEPQPIEASESSRDTMRAWLTLIWRI